jgi:hypothetical protein
MLPYLKDWLLHTYRYSEGVDGPRLTEGLP